MSRTVAGSAASTDMGCVVAEIDNCRQLSIEIHVPRDCLVGDCKTRYRNELEMLFRETLDLYFRMA
jgi:hypothetical protein